MNKPLLKVTVLSTLGILLLLFQNCGRGLTEQNLVDFAMASPRPLSTDDLEKFTTPCSEVQRLGTPNSQETCLHIFVNEKFPNDIGNGLHPEFPVASASSAVRNATVYYSHPDLDQTGKKLIIFVQEGAGNVPPTSANIGFSITVHR